MGSMKDLLGDKPYALSYPDRPGYKVADPSRDAAERFAGLAKGIRAQVLAAIEATGDHGATSDELMTALGLAEIVIRPRVSELHRAGEIVPIGRRRGNSGLDMSVWRVAPPLPAYSHIQKGTAR